MTSRVSRPQSRSPAVSKAEMELSHQKSKWPEFTGRVTTEERTAEKAPETWRELLFSSLLNGDQSLRKRKRLKAQKHTTCQLLRKQCQVQTGPGNLNSLWLEGLFTLTSSATV